MNWVWATGYGPQRCRDKLKSIAAVLAACVVPVVAVLAIKYGAESFVSWLDTKTQQ